MARRKFATLKVKKSRGWEQFLFCFVLLTTECCLHGLVCSYLSSRDFPRREFPEIEPASVKRGSAGPIKCGSHCNISGGSVCVRHATAADGFCEASARFLFSGFVPKVYETFGSEITSCLDVTQIPFE